MKEVQGTKTNECKLYSLHREYTGITSDINLKGYVNWRYLYSQTRNNYLCSWLPERHQIRKGPAVNLHFGIQFLPFKGLELAN